MRDTSKTSRDIPHIHTDKDHKDPRNNQKLVFTSFFFFLPVKSRPEPENLSFVIIEF